MANSITVVNDCNAGDNNMRIVARQTVERYEASINSIQAEFVHCTVGDISIEPVCLDSAVVERDQDYLLSGFCVQQRVIRTLEEITDTVDMQDWSRAVMFFRNPQEIDVTNQVRSKYATQVNQLSQCYSHTGVATEQVISDYSSDEEFTSFQVNPGSIHNLSTSDQNDTDQPRVDTDPNHSTPVSHQRPGTLPVNPVSTIVNPQDRRHQDLVNRVESATNRRLFTGGHPAAAPTQSRQNNDNNGHVRTQQGHVATDQRHVSFPQGPNDNGNNNDNNGNQQQRRRGRNDYNPDDDYDDDDDDDDDPPDRRNRGNYRRNQGRNRTRDRDENPNILRSITNKINAAEMLLDSDDKRISDLTTIRDSLNRTLTSYSNQYDEGKISLERVIIRGREVPIDAKFQEVIRRVEGQITDMEKQKKDDNKGLKKCDDDLYGEPSKMGLPKIKDASQVLDFLFKLQDKVKNSSASMRDNNSKVKEGVIYHLMDKDKRRCQEFSTVQEITNYLEKTYCRKDIAVRTCLQHQVKSWKQAENEKMMLGSCNAVLMKLKLIIKAKLLNDFPPDILKTLEKMVFTPEYYIDYMKNKNIFLRQQRGELPDNTMVVRPGNENTTVKRLSDLQLFQQTDQIEVPMSTIILWFKKQMEDVVERVELEESDKVNTNNIEQRGSQRNREHVNLATERWEDDDFKQPGVETVMVTTESNNKKNADNVDKECVCGCGQITKYGSIFRCNLFKKMSLEEKKNYLIRNNFCLICLVKKRPNHQCKIKNTDYYSCKDCKSKTHHWILCTKRQEKYERERALKQQEAVNLAEEEEEEEDGYDSGSDLYEQNLHVVEETIPFEKFIGTDYDNSIYNIRELLPKYVKKVQTERNRIKEERRQTETVMMMKSEEEEDDRETVNSKHPNKELFKSLTEAASKVNKMATHKKLLEIVRTRIKIKNKRVIEDDPGGLIRSGDISVEEKDGETFVLIYTMVDGGATMSLSSSDLLPYIETTEIENDNINVVGLGGNPNKVSGSHILSLVRDDREKQKVKTAVVDYIATTMTMTKEVRKIIANDCGADEETAEKINWPPEDERKKVLLLLGQDSKMIHGDMIKPADWNMSHFTINPFLTVSRIEVAANKPLCLSGMIGIDNELTVKGDEDTLYPSFYIPRDINKTDEVNSGQTDDETEDVGEETVLLTLDNNNFIEMPAVIPDDEDDLDWSDEELEQVLMLENSEDLGTIEKLLVGEMGWTVPPTICCDHRRIVATCPECKYRNTADFTDDTRISQELYDALYTIPDPDNEGQEIIINGYDYTQREEGFGTLAQSNIIDAIKCSETMFTKAEKRGVDVVGQVNKHFLKMSRLGAAIPLTAEEMQQMIDGTILHQFCSRSFVEKASSEQSSLRVVADTSRQIPLTHQTLVSIFQCPKKGLNSLMSACILFHCNQAHHEYDISSAYQCIRTSEKNSYLCLTMFYYDWLKNKTNSPVILRNSAEDFGKSDAGLVLHLAIKKFPGMELADHEYLFKLAVLLRYVDNIPVTDPSNNPETVNKMGERIKAAFQKYGMSLDKSYKPSINGEKILREATILYGLDWNLLLDLAFPHINININKTVRGRIMGEDITKQPVTHKDINRRVMARIAASVYDLCGRYLIPIMISLRILLSDICRITTKADVDTPLETISPAACDRVVKFVQELSNYKTIPPMRRYVIPIGHKVDWFILDHDGSEMGNCATLHVVTSDTTTGQQQSLILAAKAHVNRTSSFKNEFISFGRAIELLLIVVKAVRELLPTKLVVVVSGDNIPTTHLFSPNNNDRSTLVRNMMTHIKNCEEKILSLMPECQLHYTWKESSLHPSDLGTKFHEKPLEACASKLWREGPSEFLDFQKMTEHTFLFKSADKEVYTELPMTALKTTSAAAAVASPDRGETPEQVSVTTRSGANTTPDPEPQSPQPTPDLPTPPPSPPPQPLPQPSPEPPELPTTPAAATTITRKICTRTLMINNLNNINKVLPELVPKSTKAPPLITIDTERTTQMTLNNNNDYTFHQLINNTNNIRTLIKNTAALIMLANQWRNNTEIEPEMAVKEAWILLLLTDQQLHPPTTTKKTTTAKSGVTFICRNTVAENDLFFAKLQPVIDHNSDLAKLMLNNAHVEEKMFESRDLHHCAKTTKKRMVTGALGLHLCHHNLHVSNHIKNCVTCLKTDLRYYQVELGPMYSLSGTTKRPFETLSLDPMGYQMIRMGPDSKKKIPVYVIMMKCTTYSILEMVASYSIDSAGIIDALRRLQYNLGVDVREVYTDAQPSLTTQNLNPVVPEGRLWGDVQFRRHPTHGQRRNLVENSVETVKRLWSKIMETDKKQVKNKLESLHFQQFSTLLSLVTMVANQSPYTDDSSLSPADFRYILNNVYAVVNTPDSEVRGVKNLVESEVRLRKYAEACEEELKHVVLSKEEKWRQKYHNDGSKHQKTDIKISLNDVVLVPQVAGEKKMGVVTKIHSDRTVTVRTTRGQTKRMVAELHPILHSRNRYKIIIFILFLLKSSPIKHISIFIECCHLGIMHGSMLLTIHLKCLTKHSKICNLAMLDVNYIKVQIHDIFNLYKICFITVFMLMNQIIVNISNECIPQYRLASQSKRSSFNIYNKAPNNNYIQQSKSKAPDNSITMAATNTDVFDQSSLYDGILAGTETIGLTAAALSLMPSALTAIILTSLILVDTAAATPGGFTLSGDVKSNWWKQDQVIDSVSHNSYLTVDFIQSVFSRVTASIQNNLQAIGSSTTSNSQKILILTASLLLVVILGVAKVIVEWRVKKKDRSRSNKREMRTEMTAMPQIGMTRGANVMQPGMAGVPGVPGVPGGSHV